MKRLVLCLALLLGLATVASAGKLSIQGHLANGGTPTDGWHLMTFAFFSDSTGGTSLWTETDSVFVQSCLFSAVLGRAVAIPDIVFAGTAWLETSVDGTTLAPRIGYYPQPVNIGAGQWQTDGTNVWRESGRGGIGLSALSADPNMRFQVAGGRIFVGDDPTGANCGEFGKNLDTGNAFIDAHVEGSGIGFWTTDGGVNSRKMFITSNGYVGMGTASPEFPLDILTTDLTHGLRYLVTGSDPSGAGSYVLFTTNNSRGALALGNNAPWGGAEPPDAGVLLNTTGGWQWNKQLNIMGPVGINTTSTTSTLTVNGSGEFGGSLGVGGNLTVNGTKCRVVKTTAFGEVSLNATEAGHALFMDDGQSARLVNGRCRVDLTPKFLATVTIDQAHPMIVNVTFYGPHGEGWYVERDLTGFTVVDPSGSNAEFSWTATARQRGYEHVYLDPVEVQTAQK